ncbi:MAG: GAF domain-containing protein [Anaerolineales bacterium]|nr:GAF domain-containing protein [Anaerolineales bacterium]
MEPIKTLWAEVDDQGRLVESAITIGSQFHDQTTEQLRITFERGLAGWVIRNRQAVLLPDTSKDERWVSRMEEAGEPAAAKSAVSAPILARDQLVGAITLVHPAPGFFTREHLNLGQAIAGQAGIAILNARLYAESQRQTLMMAALAESSAAIASSLKLDDVLERILEQINHVLQVEMVALALIEPRTQELVFRAGIGKKGQEIVGMRLQPGQGIAGWVAQEGIGAVVPIAEEDQRYFPEFDRRLATLIEKTRQNKQFGGSLE